VEGVFSKDVVSIGDIDVQEQLFAEVSQAAFGNYGDANFDGVMGLGFRSMSRYGVPTPFEAMIEQQLIDEPVFAFHLVDPSQSSELIFGGIDESHYTGKLVDVPLTLEGGLGEDAFYEFWQVRLDGIRIGRKRVRSTTKKAVIDSGTSLMAGPTHLVADLAKKVGASSILNGQAYAIDCSKKPSLRNLHFRLGGRKFTMTPDDYIIVDRTGQVCLFAFMNMDLPPPKGPLWVLGGAFMRKFYCVFDYGNKRMRIAPAAARASYDGIRDSVLV